VSSAIQTPSDRYKNEAGFNRLVDLLVFRMEHEGWTYGDIHDAWALAEQIKHENELRRLNKERV
jgi:hypothetical protein